MLERLAQLIEVLRIAERGVLVEPLGAQALRGDADASAPVLQRYGGADNGLGALGDGDDPEPERQPQLEIALEAFDCLEFDLWRSVIPSHGQASQNGCNAPRRANRPSALLTKRCLLPQSLVVTWN